MDLNDKNITLIDQLAVQHYVETDDNVGHFRDVFCDFNFVYHETDKAMIADGKRFRIEVEAGYIIFIDKIKRKVFGRKAKTRVRVEQV